MKLTYRTFVQGEIPSFQKSSDIPTEVKNDENKDHVREPRWTTRRAQRS